jgi:hypothetical protein
LGHVQILIYADDVNFLGVNIVNTKTNIQTLIDASKDVGLGVNTEKTKYMLLSHHQNTGQSQYIKISKRCFHSVSSSDIWERR